MLNFNLRSDQVKPGHMQFFVLRSSFFYLLREIYLVRMSTSEFDFFKQGDLHPISVDPILKFETV